MELKLKQFGSFLLSRSSFNRTFMELKQYYKGNNSRYLTCFNRTFMELKHIITKTTLQATYVLIGPSWN